MHRQGEGVWHRPRPHFRFWRLDDQAPYRAAINKKLHDAAVKAKKNGITLMVENEFACNTATGAEAAKLMAQVPAPLMMLWDAANAAMDGEHAFPDGYHLLSEESHRALPLQGRDEEAGRQQ